MLINYNKLKLLIFQETNQDIYIYPQYNNLFYKLECIILNILITYLFIDTLTISITIEITHVTILFLHIYLILQCFSLKSNQI